MRSAGTDEAASAEKELGRVREAVLGERLAGTGWFQRPYLEHLVNAHQSGASDYSAPLWTLLMFEAFLRNVVDGERSSHAAQRDAELVG